MTSSILRCPPVTMPRVTSAGPGPAAGIFSCTSVLPAGSDAAAGTTENPRRQRPRVFVFPRRRNWWAQKNRTGAPVRFEIGRTPLPAKHFRDDENDDRAKDAAAKQQVHE